MPDWLNVILEIIKITVPALIVFLTVYYLLRTYLDKQYQMRLLDNQQSRQETTLPLRLQAYERFSLFCERISLPNLLFRVRQDGMSAAQLRVSLLLAIQQEFEHNITQQVYVSNQLWEIIKAARDDTINNIEVVAETVDPKADGRELATQIFNLLERREKTGVDQALAAIKKEAALLL